MELAVNNWNKYSQNLIWIICLCLFALPSTGQIIRNTPSTVNSTIKNDTITTEKDDLLTDLLDDDTIQVKYYYATAPQRLLWFKDTLLNTNTRMYDIGRFENPNTFHLGNIASPGYEIFWNTLNRKQFEFMPMVSIPYQADPDKMYYYQSSKPFTQLRYFTTLGTKDDNHFNGDFGKTFDNNLNFAIHFTRINQLGTFSNDHSRNTNLNTGFNKVYLNGKLKTDLIYSFNQYLREENGGIISDTLLTANNGITADPLNVPVWTKNAISKKADWSLFFNTEWTLSRVKKDSTAKIRTWQGDGLKLGVDLKYHQDKFIYSNKDSTHALIYYRGLFTDIRGIQNKFFHNYWGAFGFLKFTTKKKNEANLANTYIRIGLNSERHRLEYLPLDSTFYILQLKGDALWYPSKNISLQANGFYALSSLNPTFDINGTLSTSIKSWAELKVWGNIKNLYPEWQFQSLHINQTIKKSYDLGHIFETKLGGQIYLPALRLKGYIQQSILKNYTYFDQKWQAAQNSDPISVTSVGAFYHLKLGVFNLENNVVFQKTTSNIIRLPGLYTNHSIYFQQKMFKKNLLLSAGFDFRFTPAFTPMSYAPILGGFYLDDVNQTNTFFGYDFFINFKIRLFRMTFRLDNINSIYDKKLFYQVAGYPQDLFKMRLGIVWLFNN